MVKDWPPAPQGVPHCAGAHAPDTPCLPCSGPPPDWNLDFLLWPGMARPVPDRVVRFDASDPTSRVSTAHSARRGGKMTGSGLGPYARCMDRKTDYLIAASDVVSYEAAPFNVWCKYFADQSERDPPTRALEFLSRGGRQYEEDVRRAKYPNAVVIENGSHTKEERARFDPVSSGERVLAECSSDSFKRGIELMAAGEATIATCPLYDLRHGMCGTPDILERADGPSLFGSHHYVVKEIKSARSIHRHHKMQTAFYNLLIGRIQGHVPEKFHIIGGSGSESEFVFSTYEDALKVALARVADIRNGGEVPIPTYGSSPYPWRAFCNKRAVEAGDVSIIGNMRRRDLDALRRNGIRTIRNMLSLRISDISLKCGIGADTARNYWQSAASLDIKWPIRRMTAKTQLPMRRTEVFLDIGACRVNRNGASDGFTVYMVGALVRNGRNKRYVSFVADSAGERKVVDGILGLLEDAKDYAVYHCNVRNCEHLKKAIERHRAGTGSIRSITSGGRMFNLHGRAVALYAFPVPGNDISSIAGYIGFKRTHPEIDANWLCSLYNEYRKDAGANAGILEMMQENSMDNCMAMAAVKDWLAEDAEGSGYLCAPGRA